MIAADGHDVRFNHTVFDGKGSNLNFCKTTFVTRESEHISSFRTTFRTEGKGRVSFQDARFKTEGEGDVSFQDATLTDG
ncbi:MULTISPECIES: hypothetical protein [unclassified Natrinema]|uniref:hypothetical protein n=1 Tax=unclassified Natrinema TaxID=2622230 RepID=UPI00026D47E6|nr:MULTISPECIES: hypothetical protein [unclassified Natrinema]AFO59141.1 hypothetical protein NJ7G_3924 [Natrinema sp. J7-2]